MIKHVEALFAQINWKDFCRIHRVRRLWLFGSALRSDFRADSDIDILVDFDEGVVITYFKLARIQEELSVILGRRVDIGLPYALDETIRDKTMASAQILYDCDR